ncbi:MAG: AMP-binding protein [Gammaproteobacteria bacterium]|nr:AMP-binding protein [Gammaproteobacteria bacterium]
MNSSHRFAKALSRGILRVAFRVRLREWQHVNPSGRPTLIIANHVSFLDGALLWAFVPGRVRFAISTLQARTWWIRLIVRWTGLYPLDQLNPMAFKSFIEELKAGHTMGIFPEGRMTRTGGLMKMYQGPATAADHAGADILPIHIEGAQFHVSGNLGKRVRVRRWPRVTLTAGAPRQLELPRGLSTRERRQAAAHALGEMLTETAAIARDTACSVPHALIEAARAHGPGQLVIDDMGRTPWSYRTLFTKAHAIGELIARRHAAGANVGLMLPNSAGSAAVLIGMLLHGRVPAMVNFTAGAGTIKQAMRTADVTTVYTSRRFIDEGGFQELADALAAELDLRYLDDLREEVDTGLKLTALWRAWRGSIPVPSQRDDPAVILFTSGSEGLPKGVVLSHGNLLANCTQITARMPFLSDEVLFAALPLFHAFGLTGGLFLPLMNGVRTFLYPTPLHYKLIPELVYDVYATAIFGSNTFLAGYARHADPMDFTHLRYVVAGAEKLQEGTRRLWLDKFGVRILEGYGATETSPVLSVNSPRRYRAGSVGPFLPRVEYRLEPVDGVREGGRLIVRGPNIMLGYLRAEQPGVLEAPGYEFADGSDGTGWYDTGDIARVEDDFLILVDRAKRFAKIGGEMVSLAGVESLAHALWPQLPHAAVAIPDARKGERIVLITEHPDVNRHALTRRIQETGGSELSVPAEIRIVDAVPTLSTGKTDYRACRALAESALPS